MQPGAYWVFWSSAVMLLWVKLYLRLQLDQRAVTAIEYPLIAALIAVVILGAVSGLGKGAGNTFNKVASEL
jgi:pilus assembly protein Flp/PilA